MRMNTIKKAAEEDRNAILKLYRTRLYGPADWNEYYPNEETIEFDLSRDALFVMKNDAGELIATISIDEDEEVDSLTVWDENIAPAGELARLCVREDMQNQGIAKEMMRYAFDALKEQGKKSVLTVIWNCSSYINYYWCCRSHDKLGTSSMAWWRGVVTQGRGNVFSYNIIVYAGIRI